MATAVWPPISPQDLVKEEEASLTRELEWLLDHLQECFASLKAGLEECAALLSPEHGGSTLVLSTLRSESVKGFVTRTSTRILKGDINLRLPGLIPPRGATSSKLSISTAPDSPTLILKQLTDVRTLINASLDVIDVSRWAGDAKNASFISGQLRLLFDNIQEAKQTLHGTITLKPWWEDSVEEKIFDPPHPKNLSLHLSILEAALVLHVRTLEPANATAPAESITGYGFRERFAQAIGASKGPSHDEAGDTFTFRGQEVRVREKLRVESQDPTLLAVMAKLSALEHGAAMSRRALDTVMGKEE